MWFILITIGVIIGVVLLIKIASNPAESEDENLKFLKTQQKRNEGGSTGRYLVIPDPFENHGKASTKKTYRLDYDCAYDFDSYPFEIVGESHYQSNISQLAVKREGKGCFTEVEARVVREPNNSYDKNACKVDINGLTVGYFPSNNAESWVKLLSRLNMLDSSEVYVKAVIIGGGGKEYSFGVKLDIPSRVANSAKYIKEI